MNAVVSEFPPTEANQLAGTNRPYEIDVSALAVPAWQANIWIPPNSLIRPTMAKQTGFLYQGPTSAGQTGNAEPNWPITGSIQDGSVIWTPIAPPSGSEDTISSVSWTQVSPPDSALTISTPTHDGLTTMAYIGGGTSAQTYLILVTITMASGALYRPRIYVTVL